jgi:hypothetical protein
MILVALFALAGLTQDTTRTVTWGGFVDMYYAWDFNRPGNLVSSLALSF